MQVGFIGLGTMGASMAANLQKAGHTLVVHDVRQTAAAPHVKAGARWADSPKALAAHCKVIFTSLPGPPEVEAVGLGPNGLMEGLEKGSAWFDLTTNSPTLVRRMHQIYSERGLHLLDAPVSGGPQGAKTGRLAIWVGGEEAIFARYKSLLDDFGDSARYIGPIGAGSIAKLVHNCAGYAIQTALAEVFSLGIKGGVEPLALWEAVRTGATGRQRTFDRLHDQFLANNYDPPSFALKLAHKDMRLATELGRELGVPMRLANMAFAEMTEALNRGWENRDSRSPMLLQLERCGVKVEIDPERIAAVLDRDAPATGGRKSGA
jgi:3-hydroxyisobutyrate dehydrogenase-like beta-hydroxyacid dehydrogenase